jgi:phage tail sheath protein FI
MPEYLAPGVFVEETSYRHKPIEGVSTSTTAFIGPTRDGPISGEPPLLTSYQEFQEIYGGMDPLAFGGSSGDEIVNFVAQAARAYFEEGGRRLYVARAFERLQENSETGAPVQVGGTDWSDGIGRWSSGDNASQVDHLHGNLTIRSRYPGAAGNRLLTFTFHLGPNILDPTQSPVLRGVDRLEVVWVTSHDGGSPSALSGAKRLYWVDRVFDAQGQPGYRLRVAGDNPQNAPGPDTIQNADLATTLGDVRVLTVSVSIEGRGRFRGRFDFPKTYENLTFHPGQLAPTARQTLTDTFDAAPTRRATALFAPIVLETQFNNGAQVADLLTASINMAGTGTVLDAFADEVQGFHLTSDSQPKQLPVTDLMRSMTIELRGGNDGLRPAADQYAGLEAGDGPLFYIDGPQGTKSGLLSLEDVEDVSIVAAPGSTFNALNGYQQNARTITGFLLSHCERMRYRVAVLDSPDGAIVGEVRDERARLDSKYGALYYPWVRAFDPISENEIVLPPSGYITGIYARNDVERGVHKAPANEVIRLATGFETLINKGQQEVLNPLGVNCLRFFEGRGFRVWGARGITSDGEWKYINLRRNFCYLGRSIELGTQWAVFEPNAEELWANVRRAVEDFLYNEWKNTRLMGVTPEEAFFVRCDRTTMTQADIDNGRLICLVGVALLKPAEFVIFRIGQKTLDFKG